MKLKTLPLFGFLLTVIYSGIVSSAVTTEDFLVKKTQDLVNLCTATSDDPNQNAALHFCHGYLVGAFHYYQAQEGDSKDTSTVCLETPHPTRNQTIEMFINWAKKHPEYMNEIPVDTEFRFLEQLWPCKK